LTSVPGSPTNNNGKKRILVVDDDFNITELTQIILETAGYECQTTNSGKECVKLLGDRNGRFDLILLDVAMPGFSGLDVVNTVKEQKLFPLKRIVLFTASSAPFLEDKEIKGIGVLDCFKKPFKKPDLLSAVQRYVTS